MKPAVPDHISIRAPGALASAWCDVCKVSRPLVGLRDLQKFIDAHKNCQQTSTTKEK